MKAALLIFFIGSYTEYPIPDFGGIGHGIYTVQLNTETGELTILHTMKARNPSYLVISDDNQFLYCVNEIDESENPKVGAYKINADYSLEFLNDQPIAGGYPCYIQTFGNNVLVACYATGNVIQFPLDVSGKLMKAKKEYQHKGSSINTARQEAPHAHQVAVHPNNEDIYVCDLGIDALKAYGFQRGELMPNEKNDVTISKGGGPRHLVFNKAGNLGYVNNELTGTVSVLQRKEGSFDELKVYSALPDDYSGVASGSAIRIHPNGQFLYVANRKLEAISIFRIDKDKLEPIDYQYTNGAELREFNITPDGKWLIACHQNSHDTVSYQIQEDGRLQERYRTKEILSPVCVVFD
jgi:6-phosphogluconolactonase